jgi:hypothetical protein
MLSLYYHFYRFLEGFPTEANPDTPVAVPGLPTVAADELPLMVTVLGLPTATTTTAA